MSMFGPPAAPPSLGEKVTIAIIVGIIAACCFIGAIELGAWLHHVVHISFG